MSQALTRQERKLLADNDRWWVTCKERKIIQALLETNPKWTTRRIPGPTGTSDLLSHRALVDDRMVAFHYFVGDQSEVIIEVRKGPGTLIHKRVPFPFLLFPLAYRTLRQVRREQGVRWEIPRSGGLVAKWCWDNPNPTPKSPVKLEVWKSPGVGNQVPLAGSTDEPTKEVVQDTPQIVEREKPKMSYFDQGAATQILSGQPVVTANPTPALSATANIPAQKAFDPTQKAFDPTQKAFDTVDEAVTAADGDWRVATVNLCRYFVALGECFSSGEIARFIRLINPSIRFAVGAVGEYIRDNYFAGNLGYYDNGDGEGTTPVQVHRQTEGRYPDRTPADTDVFVYGPDVNSAKAHDFEVYVPRPEDDEAAIQHRDNNPAPAQPISPRTPASVSAGLPQVKVGSDNRLYIPRKVVDAYCALGHHIDGNTKVYVLFGDGSVQVSFQDNGGKEYNIWQGTGRIAIYPGDDVSWQPGAEFSVTVDNSGIQITL